MPPDRRLERQELLRRRLPESGIHALLVSHPPNIRYLTGFTGSAGMLLVSRDRTVLLTDARYALQAPPEVRGAAEVVIEAGSVWDRLATVLQAVKPGVLGFERERLTVQGAERLSSMESVRLMPVGRLVEALRIIKDPSEVASIRAAASLALDAFESVIPSLRAGESELAVASRLEAALRVRGSEWHPFQTIVASGPNSALPHARAGARTVRSGEFLLLDFGAQLDGYCSDLTRTVVIGRADGRQREVYEAVRAAQGVAMTRMRAGMTGRQADALARRSLEERGLAAGFRHSLGHGLGLEVHEDPRVSPMVEVPLPVDAVVTVEPGAYFEGWGGVRLEDDVLLTSEGPEWLSPGAPELMEVP